MATPPINAVDLDAYLGSRRKRVEQALDRLVPSAEEPPQRLNQAIRHSLMGGGKRLRPVLVLAACEAVGGKTERLMHWACALECVHTYSLIHDDLPAMDDDDLRRGRATCHKQFDEATAILAGDALLTLAFELAAAPVSGADPSETMAMIAQFADGAGIRGMVGGQMMDILAEEKRVTLETLQTIHRKKTGALIRTACVTGARLGGGTDDQIRRLIAYGEAIGLAFQIMDDILDETGDSALLGKATGQDRQREKSTYPQLMGLEPARSAAESRVRDALDSLKPFPSAADPLRALANYILTRTH